MNIKCAKVVTIASFKGGAGKTAITSLLARYFVEIEGRKVLVIDFDGRGGITSMLHKEALTKDTLSIAEMMMDIYQYIDPHDTFNQAVIDINIEESCHWRNNGGSLHLLPSKPNLDDVLSRNTLNLLSDAITAVGLTNEFIILIDPGPDLNNVLSAFVAADIAFIPLRISPQDVHPTIKTLQTLAWIQSVNKEPTLGGIVVNQTVNTKWEQRYIDNYQKIFERFQENSEVLCSSQDLFILQKHSRIIQRGNHLRWPWRDDILNSTRQIAEVINEFEKPKMECNYGY